MNGNDSAPMLELSKVEGFHSWTIVGAEENVYRVCSICGTSEYVTSKGWKVFGIEVPLADCWMRRAHNSVDLAILQGDIQGFFRRLRPGSNLAIPN